MAGASPSPPDSGRPPDSAEAHRRRGPRDGPWWLYPALLIAAIVITALVARQTHHPPAPAGTGERAARWQPAPQPQGKTVSLEIDFGNGARRIYDALAWREGMTVADLMQTARQFRPPIRYRQRGAGADAFLDSLEGVAGGGPGRANWLYQVNGQHADVGFGVRQLKPGDAVLWRYETRE